MTNKEKSEVMRMQIFEYICYLKSRNITATRRRVRSAFDISEALFNNVIYDLVKLRLLEVPEKYSDIRLTAKDYKSDIYQKASKGLV